MEQHLLTAIEYQTKAAGSAALAMKYRFAIIDGKLPEFMGYPRDRHTCVLTVTLNDRDSRAFYAAARAIAAGI